MRSTLGLSWFLIALLLPQGTSAWQGECRLLLSPPQAVVELVEVEQTTAGVEVQVQIVAPPQRSWRLLLQPQGPPLVLAGRPLPQLHLTWKGQPARFFREGAASQGQPQLCAQGQGPAQGVLRLQLQLPLTAGAGHWRQRLLFFLESP
ncbi:MAG: hypothetical protein ACUVRZ_12635 [Desulfobacca sp.]|uniref:hypothetical protein n=1 Tax=Desulfobacca sp. TaxID=2067990 RepID=UPI00404920A9